MTDPLPPEAFALALSLLPGCGHHRLRALLAADADAAGAAPDAGAVWAQVRAGRLTRDRPDLVEALGRGGSALLTRWAAAAATADVAASWAAACAAGIGVWLAGGPGYPEALVDDPEPPPVLFWQGAPAATAPPAVAIVGTRRCTAYGTDVARELGRDLAAAGVTVVSGLALGIDGAAHEGALAAGEGAAAPLAVVGSGLDVVYPPRHASLWRRVREAGLLLSESPPGAAPEAWRFPRRNRILAGLAKVVVVVESHASGGSLSTVRAALDRGVAVMAVPGSVRSASSVGTNHLLADGVAPVTGVEDVLTALALEGATLGAETGRAAVGRCTRDPAPSRSVGVDDVDGVVLDAVDWTPTTTEDVLRRSGLDLTEASARLVALEVRGLVRRNGAWWERVAVGRNPTGQGYTART